MRQLNSEQLAAVFESPTFIALLKLLGNVDFDDRNEEALLLSIEGERLGFAVDEFTRCGKRCSVIQLLAECAKVHS